MSPDVILGWQLWRACYIHDQFYSKGYAKGYGHVDSKEEADLVFYTLLERRSNTVIATLYWIGVRTQGGRDAWNSQEEDRHEWKKEHEQKLRESQDAVDFLDKDND